MKKLLNFVFKSHQHTYLVALVLSAIPFLQWLSRSIMATFTLHNGSRPGFLFLIWITFLPIGLLLLKNMPFYVLIPIFITGVLVWGYSSILHRTNSWRLILQINTIIGLATIACIFIFIPNLHAQLLNVFTSDTVMLMFQPLFNSLNISDIEAQKLFLEKLITFFIGFSVAFQLLIVLSCVFIGRWFQAILYNPGGLKKEMYGLQLSRIDIVLLLLLLILAGVFKIIPIEVVPILGIPLLVVGLSLIHNIIAKKMPQKLQKALLILFYLLFTFAAPYVGLFLIVLVIIDSLINIRKRI